MKMKTIHPILIAAASIAALATALTGAEAPVKLGTAGNFAILSKAGVSTTGETSVIGNVGVSPIDATGITGFSLTLDATGTFSTSPLVTGNVYASDYAPPTPSNMTTAVSDMELAYADAAGRSSGDAVTELGAGDISGLTLAPGLYQWSSGLLINTDLTLAGPSDGVWIFQIAQNLTMADGVAIILSGGARASRIFWQVAGEANLGTTSHFEGVLLSKTAIHLQTGASINGSLLAQTAVTLDAVTVRRTTATSGRALHWFGSFNDSRVNRETGEGWLDHAEHGWLYQIETARGMWVWDHIQQDWLWTREGVYPFFYSDGLEDWIFYEKGGNPTLRWFFFYNEQSENGGDWLPVRSGNRLTQLNSN